MFSYISAINPVSCKDFFSRVSSATFAGIAIDTCFTTTIDPQGPGMGDPPVSGILCCKRDDDVIRTMVSLLNIYLLYNINMSYAMCYNKGFI